MQTFPPVTLQSPRATWPRVMECLIVGATLTTPPKKGITVRNQECFYYDKKIAQYEKEYKILTLRVREAMFTVHGKDAVSELAHTTRKILGLEYPYMWLCKVQDIWVFTKDNNPYTLWKDLHPWEEPTHKHHGYLHYSRIDSAIEAIQNQILSVRDMGLNDYAQIQGEFVGDLLPQHTSYTKLGYLDGVWSISVERLTPKERRHLAKGQKPIPYNTIKLIPRTGPDVSGL